jgi:hypothetical protein
MAPPMPTGSAKRRCIGRGRGACNADAGLRFAIASRIDRAMLNDLARTAKAGLEMILHLVLALLAAACLKLSELAWTWLFPGPQPLVLGLFPYRWILDFGDVAIIVVFTGFAIVNAIRIMGEK